MRIDYPTYTRRLYYDSLQRVTQETDILDANTICTTSYNYDEAGNVISETDEEGNTTTYEYDALNRLIKLIDSLGGITERRYDDRGNLILLKDPKDGITRYEYDRNSRMVKRTRPMGEETVYEYDVAGNRVAVLDAKGQKIAYEYNALNRLVRTLYYTADDHLTPIKTVAFTYDKLGNFISYDDGTTSATYTYDHLERKSAETVDYGSFSLSHSYTYYANDLKKSFTDPNGITYDYTYDAGNRLRSIGIPGQGQITYNTYQWNSPTKITIPGGTTAEYTYDPLMQLKSIGMKDPAQNIFMAYNYQYSPVGNITGKNTEHCNYAYQYDQLHRLIDATNPTAADESYTYDAIGNRLTAAGVEGSWSYNDNCRLLGYSDVSYEYDDNGNMIQKSVGGQVLNYIYNIEDRLVRVEDGGGPVVAEYYYDPFGRRLWKDVGGVRTHYFYSDEGLIAEYDASGNEIKAYGYAPDTMWTTDPLFQKGGGIYYWYQNDHLGTSQKIIDTSGRIVWEATYDSFGNCQITVSDIENNLRFSGQYYDAETGLYYNWNRYYDPVSGRYLQEDPVGNFKRIQLYIYCGNNPLNHIDPFGLCKKDVQKWSFWKTWQEMYGLLWEPRARASRNRSKFRAEISMRLINNIRQTCGQGGFPSSPLSYYNPEWYMFFISIGIDLARVSVTGAWHTVLEISDFMGYAVLDPVFSLEGTAWEWWTQHAYPTINYEATYQSERLEQEIYKLYGTPYY